MITIKIKRNQDGKTTITARGHAEFNPGNDIVCSGVSALFYAFGAYVTSTSGIEAECRFGDGYSRIKFNKDANEAFKMFEIGLKLIESEYKEYVKVIE